MTHQALNTKDDSVIFDFRSTSYTSVAGGSAMTVLAIRLDQGHSGRFIDAWQYIHMVTRVNCSHRGREQQGS